MTDPLIARRYYLLATSAWFLAFGMQSVVFAWLVTIVLREPADLVGWAQTSLLLPGMALILIAGALADRVGPDRQALRAQAFAAITPWLLVVAIQMGALNYAVMVVYALLMGVAQAFVTPSRDGLLNHVAGGQVQRTVLLTSLAQFSCQIVGYAIAGFADQVGAQPILILQSVCLLVGVWGYRQIRHSGVVQRAVKSDRSVWRDLQEGARTVMASPIMRVVVIQNVAMACFFMGCFIVCFPLVVREVFQGASEDISLLNSFNSLGLVATILLMLRVSYVSRPGRALLLAQGGGAVVLLLSGMMEAFIPFVALIFLWGVCGGMAMPMARTLMQELAPPEQRARVMSFFAFSFMGAGPLGTLLSGYLSKLYGPQTAIVICASAMLTVVVVIGLTTRLWREEFTPHELPKTGAAA